MVRLMKVVTEARNSYSQGYSKEEVIELMKVQAMQELTEELTIRSAHLQDLEGIACAIDKVRHALVALS